MGKTNRARYTLEFKLEAVRLIGAGQSIAATAAILGLPETRPCITGSKRIVKADWEDRVRNR